jgi:hypothetical protein
VKTAPILAIALLSLSGFAFLLPLLVSPDKWNKFLPVSIALGVLQSILSAASIYRLKKKRLWFAVGLLFAVIWPGVFAWIVLSCTWNSRYCP